MAFYDAERLIEDADAELVAEYINMEMRKKGNYVYIKCPGHLEHSGKEDTNFGSCLLTQKGYHCFTCNRTVSLPNMIMESENVSYSEALGIIGDALGGREHYILEGKVSKDYDKQEKILSNEDLEMIGLSSTISFDLLCFPDNSKQYIQQCNYNAKPDYMNFNAEYYIASKNHTVSLKSLLNEAPALYYTLIKNNAYLSMQKYKKCMDTICNRASAESNKLLILCENNVLSDEILYDYKNVYSEMHQRCKEIYNEIDANACIKEKLIKEDDVVDIPTYDLFD